jgi:Fic family protein
VAATARDAVERIGRISSLHERYRRLVIENSRSQAPLAAVDLVMDRVIVTASDLEQHAKCSNPTARTALATLESLGIVEPAAMRYPARWIAAELVQTAYEQ